jgi:putative restriction endonuclease
MDQYGSLIDAAHIVPDSEKHGFPTVNNGIALCKIHHAAYDQNILGVTPDFEVRIAQKVLLDVDGPMLKHGLQEMRGRPLHLPKRRADRPGADLLDWRYARFGVNA